MNLTIVNAHGGGHYAHYLEALVDGWSLRTSSGRVSDRLAMVVTPEIARTHPRLPEKARDAGIQWVEFRSPLADPNDRIGRERWMRASLAETLPALRPDHLFFSYLDHFLLTVSFSRLGVPMSGILFRPSFHYEELGVSQPLTRRERLGEGLKRELLRLALRRIDRVFLLDDTAVEPIRNLGTKATPLALPEVFDARPSLGRPAFLTSLEPGRHMFTSLGVLDRRKGVLEVLDAVRQVPEDLQRRTALVVAGHLCADVRDDAETALRTIRQTTRVQIIVEDRFLNEEEVQPTIELADTVLVPYQRHTGSSGILIRAAAAGRPVIASDYGLVGLNVRRHRLGEAVDATSPARLREALVRRLEGLSPGFDRRRAHAFASANTAERHARTIFDGILGP